MRRTARSVATAALLATAPLVLAACTGAGPDAKDPGDITGTTLTIFAPQGPDQNLATNSATAAIEKALGITIRWRTTGYDPTLADQERRRSLAGADLPDAYLLVSWVTLFSRAELQELGGKGTVVPLNELIHRYAPHVEKALADTPAWRRTATAPDGTIYGLPQWNDCFHCSYPYKLWMNSAWLKELGLTRPRTTEDLRTVLRAFKTRDPNHNGKADEVPLTGVAASQEGGLVPYLMNAFLYDPGAARPDLAPLVLQGGRVQFQPAQDGYRRGLQYIASLYAEGLIDQAGFTQSIVDLRARGQVRGAVLLGAVATMHPQDFVLLGQPDGRDKEYDAVPPLAGPDGTAYSTYRQPSPPGGMFVITSKATPAQRVAAIKILDYLVDTPGHLRAEFGEEGRTWVKPRPGDQALDPSLSPLFTFFLPASGTRPPNDSWAALAQYYSPISFRNAQVQPTDIYSVDGYERRLFQATKLYEGKAAKDQIFPDWSVWLDRGVTDEAARLQAALQHYVAENEVQFITGRKALDAVSWSAYLDGLRDLGLQRYLALMQQAYDASK